MWTYTHMSDTSCLTPVDQGVITVTDNTDCCTAVVMNTSYFTRCKTQCDEATFRTQDLSGAACRSCQLTTLTSLQFNIVNESTIRDVLEQHCVTDLDVHCFTRDDCVTNVEVCRADDITLFTIYIVEKSDVCISVWIVFDTSYLCRYIVLVSLEVNDSVLLLDTAALMTGCDSTCVATATLTM